MPAGESMLAMRALPMPTLTLAEGETVCSCQERYAGTVAGIDSQRLVDIGHFLSAGIVSFATMQVNNDPDIDFPIVIVQISQPGAAPVELENQVTQKVESAVRSLSGIDEIDSTVTEGQSVTLVQLNIGTPIDRAVEDVRSAIQQIRSNLPDGILEPQVGRVDTASDNDLGSYAAITSDMT